MSKKKRSVPVVVSVQDTGMERVPWDGHVATGVLATRDTLVVGTPAEEIADPSRGFEALIVPVRLSEERIIERIRVVGVEVLCLSGDNQITGMVLQLAHKSRYRPEFSSFDGGQLIEELTANDNDLMAALESLGSVSGRQREGISRTLLHAVPHFERIQRSRRITVRKRRPEDTFDWCDLVKWPCLPPPPPEQPSPPDQVDRNG